MNDEHLHLTIEEIESCPDCRKFAAAERVLAARLAALPLFNPAAGFGERVMAAVKIPSRRPIRAAAIAAGLIGSMGLSIAWSLTNPDALAQVGNWLSAEGSQMLWVGLRGTASNLLEQPWYDAARDLVATPARVGLVTGSTVLAYICGLAALRRLLTVPAHRVARAGA